VTPERTSSKALALDYGSARTGVAVSDPSGMLARPLCVVAKVGSKGGLAELCAIIDREAPGVVVVGLPLTLRGERGTQAVETEAFIARLRSRCRIPILTEDERLTTSIARRQMPMSSRRRSSETTSDDAQAAAVLLQTFLDRRGVA
jgi:putative holliday junction resolvase